MTQTAFCSKVSVPLIRENLRRYWAIPALAFLVYFLSGVFPILLRYANLNNFASTIEDMLNNMHPFFMGVHIALPLITGVMLFRYLQNSGTMTTAHSLPFSRAKLYWTNVVTGLIMSLGPMVVTGLILLAIKKPSYRRYTWSIENGIEPENVFTAAQIGEWMFVSALVIIVIFAVTVFAGIVTGNSLLHFVMAIVFNFLIPGLFAVLALYCEQYLYGFNTSGDWYNFCMFLSPFLHLLENGGDPFGLGAVLLYVATFVVLIVLSAIFYSKRKLERVSDPLVFGILRPIIIYIAAFFVMTLMSFYFEALVGGDLFRNIGYVVGALLGFIVASMIIYKTLKIFNMAHLRNLGIFAVIMILVICSFHFDFYGFEKRVPDPQKISSAYVGGIANLESTYGTEGEISDLETLQHVVDLHEFILENRDVMGSYEYYDAYRRSVSFNFYYTMENGLTLSRRYSVPYSLAAASPALKSIYESDALKENNTMAQLLPEQLKYAEVNSRYKQVDYVLLDNVVDVRQLLDCLQADYRERSFEDMTQWLRPQCSISFAYYALDTLGNVDYEEERWIEFVIDEHYERTLAWLESHEETAQIPISPADISYMLIQQSVPYEDQEIYYYEGGSSMLDMEKYMAADVAVATRPVDIGSLTIAPPESTADALVLTEGPEIQEVLDTGCMYEPNMPLYYTVNVVLKENGPYADEYADAFTVYYTEEKAPDWMKNYFTK